MNTIQTWTELSIEALYAGPVDRTPELVIIPVSDIDRAKRFYAGLGWKLDIDATRGNDYRVIQFTPPGSDWSVMFGKHLTAAAPGSVQGLHLVVSDIEEARRLLRRRGAMVSEPFHDAFHRDGTDTQRETCAAFSDPDGNGWVFHAAAARKN